MTTLTTPELTVVVPVYRNEGSVTGLVEALLVVSDKVDGEMECVFVVDGSPDRSAERLRDELTRASLRAVVIEHSRNFGSFAAIRTGLGIGTGKHFGVMAADLQEPPELMIEFLDHLREGDVQVVVGQRRQREGDRRRDRLSARLFWVLYRRFVLPTVPTGGVDVFACTREVRDRVLQCGESHSSLIGLLFWLGYDAGEVPYERRDRSDGGISAWTFRKKLTYMMDSIYSFTDLPLRILRAIGLLGLITSLTVSVVVTIAWWRGSIRVAGYTPLILAVAVSTMSILSALGILGSYVWRAYENTKQRPLSVVERTTFYE